MNIQSVYSSEIDFRGLGSFTYTPQVLDIYDQFNKNVFDDAVKSIIQLRDFTRSVMKKCNSSSRAFFISELPESALQANSDRVVIRGRDLASCPGSTITSSKFPKDVHVFQLVDEVYKLSGETRSKIRSFMGFNKSSNLRANIYHDTSEANKFRPERVANPIQEQLELACMVDWCLENNCNKVGICSNAPSSALDTLFIDALRQVCKNLEVIYIQDWLS